MTRPRLLAALALALASVGAACHRVQLPAAVHDVSVPRVVPPRPGRGSIVGIVADSTTGYPVVGASVYFTRDTVIGFGPARPRTDLPRATTDRGGGFALRDIPPGRYTLAFSDYDHVPARRVVVVRADQIDSLTLRPRRI